MKYTVTWWTVTKDGIEPHQKSFEDIQVRFQVDMSIVKYNANKLVEEETNPDGKLPQFGVIGSVVGIALFYVEKEGRHIEY